MKFIQDVKQGDFFTKKVGAKKVFQKGKYCRINKAYECTNVDDISDYIYLKKNKLVNEIDY